MVENIYSCLPFHLLDWNQLHRKLEKTTKTFTSVGMWVQVFQVWFQVNCLSNWRVHYPAQHLSKEEEITASKEARWVFTYTWTINKLSKWWATLLSNQDSCFKIKVCFHPISLNIVICSEPQQNINFELSLFCTKFRKEVSLPFTFAPDFFFFFK